MSDRAKEILHELIADNAGGWEVWAKILAQRVAELEKERDQIVFNYHKQGIRMQELEKALRDLHDEVEMAESIGICLPNRVPSLRARDLLAVSEETPE
jgi:hypothetical protein